MNIGDKVVFSRKGRQALCNGDSYNRNHLRWVIDLYLPGKICSVSVRYACVSWGDGCANAYLKDHLKVVSQGEIYNGY